MLPHGEAAASTNLLAEKVAQNMAQNVAHFEVVVSRIYEGKKAEYQGVELRHELRQK